MEQCEHASSTARVGNALTPFRQRAADTTRQLSVPGDAPLLGQGYLRFVRKGGELGLTSYDG